MDLNNYAHGKNKKTKLKRLLKKWNLMDYEITVSKAFIIINLAELGLCLRETFNCQVFLSVLLILQNTALANQWIIYIKQFSFGITCYKTLYCPSKYFIPHAIDLPSFYNATAYTYYLYKPSDTNNFPNFATQTFVYSLCDIKHLNHKQKLFQMN